MFRVGRELPQHWQWAEGIHRRVNSTALRFRRRDADGCDRDGRAPLYWNKDREIGPRLCGCQKSRWRFRFGASGCRVRPVFAMTDYKVKFEVFEGPLDLLLYLIKKEEVDIYEVNLTQLATQFIEYLDLMRVLDLDVAGEFLVMAATLMYIKSRELLPVDQQEGEEGEEEGEDTR